MFKQPRRNVSTTIILIIIILATAWLFWKKNSTVENQISGTTTEKKQTSDITASYVRLSDFNEFDRARKIINETQGKNEYLSGYEIPQDGVVADPNAEDTVYFSTTDIPGQEAGIGQKMFQGIYQFNTIDNHWQRLYKTTTVFSKEKPFPKLRVVGMTNNSLILLSDTRGEPLFPCESLWIIQPENLMLMRLDDPYSGFTPFSIPNAKRIEEEQKMQNCLKK